MAFRLPIRDPRTVARDIPGVLDALFPRLSGGLVTALNKNMLAFKGIEPVPEELIAKSQLQKSMLFELSMVRVECALQGEIEADWDAHILAASKRQRRHFDAKVPDKITQCDIDVASHAAVNLLAMLTTIRKEEGNPQIELAPIIPGFGWIASGNGDFSVGSTLIEVKHTDRNFLSGDFRQVLMYWLLKYAYSIENKFTPWTEVILLNPRRNAALRINFDFLLRSASANFGRVELLELLRSIVLKEQDR